MLKANHVTSFWCFTTWFALESFIYLLSWSFALQSRTSTLSRVDMVLLSFSLTLYCCSLGKWPRLGPSYLYHENSFSLEMQNRNEIDYTIINIGCWGFIFLFHIFLAFVCVDLGLNHVLTQRAIVCYGRCASLHMDRRVQAKPIL